MFQMRFYALAWWRMTSELPRRLQLMYLGNGEVLRYEPDEDGLRSTERKVLALRDAIGRAADAEAFDPSRPGSATGAATEPCVPPGAALPRRCPPREEWPTSTRATSEGTSGQPIPDRVIAAVPPSTENSTSPS